MGGSCSLGLQSLDIMASRDLVERIRSEQVGFSHLTFPLAVHAIKHPDASRDFRHGEHQAIVGD
jgi:hypothetical protein